MKETGTMILEKARDMKDTSMEIFTEGIFIKGKLMEKERTLGLMEKHIQEIGSKVSNKVKVDGKGSMETPTLETG
jgi:hypothetical protein